ncbi:MAG: hypothetical protein QXU40_01725, partial [Candidatus Pacearchaeota archaeon]
SIPTLITNISLLGKRTGAKGLSIRFEPPIINFSMATNSTTRRFIYLLGTDKDIERINLLVSDNLIPYVSISPSFIETLKNNSAERIEILFKSSWNEENLSGLITVVQENTSVSIPVFLNFIKSFVPINNGAREETNISCTQLGGSICKEGEVCESNPVVIDGENCCLSNCEKVERGQVEKTEKGKYIGWAIIILIIIFLGWFFIRYKRVRPKMKLFKEKNNHFSFSSFTSLFPSNSSLFPLSISFIFFTKF